MRLTIILSLGSLCIETRDSNAFLQKFNVKTYTMSFEGEGQYEQDMLAEQDRKCSISIQTPTFLPHGSLETMMI